MRWLYRLQSRFGMAAPEGAAALAIFLAVTGGSVVTYVQASSDPVPADVYSAADQAFADAARDAAAPAPAGPVETTGVSSPEPGAGLPPAPEDSTAAQIAEAAVETAAAPRRSGKAPPAPTNINTASEQELQRLPRIGPALAARIVEHRRAHGPFRSPDEITEVKGIGDKTLETLRPWIRL